MHLQRVYFPLLCSLLVPSRGPCVFYKKTGARGGGVGWVGDDDVLWTCTHVTCYATDGVMAWRRHKSFSQNSISLALGKHRRSKVTKVEKRASFGLWKKNWFCHAATRNYMQFCNRMCLLLTATWRRRDLLVYQSAKYTLFLLLLIWWHGLFPSLSTE